MIESKEEPTSQEGKTHTPQVVWATRNGISAFLAYQLLSLTSMERRDPERPHHKVARQNEGSFDDPVQAVVEKIKRIEASLPLENIDPRTPIVASDVVFKLNGKTLHQLIRNPEDEEKFAQQPWELEQKRLEYAQMYAGPIDAFWHVAFGFKDGNGKIKIAQIKIHCAFPDGLTKDEVYANFHPRANTGLKLVELLRQKGAQFEVLYENDFQDLEKIISGEAAQKYIVDKMFDYELWEFLLQESADLSQELQQIGLFSIAFWQQ